MMYDVCIIGSGAGASPIAYELSRAGYGVVVLEKGKYYKNENFNKDEVLVCRRPHFTPPLKDEQHTISTLNDEGEEEVVEAKDSGYNFWNGSMVGGSSNLMSGYFHRMKPNDFKLKTVFGEIKGANVVDWPIDYDEMEPYFTKVEQVVGVSGRIVKHKFLEKRSNKNFLVAPLWENPITKMIDKACIENGYTPIPTPRAVLSEDAINRSGCSYSNFCGSYGCATGAKSHARSALLDKSTCKIITEAFVYNLEEKKGKVVAAHYYDKDKKSHTIKARIFVVAAQAIESSRLLLNSKSENFPNGLANNSNQVGKNLIFSGGGSGNGRFELKNMKKEDFEAIMTRGAFVNRSLQDWYEFEKDDKRYKGGTIDFLFEHANPITRAHKQMYDDNGTLLRGTKFQQKLHYTFTQTKTLTFEVFNDWLPTDTTYVSIDDKVKDKYGVNVARVHLGAHPQDVEVGEFLAKKAEKVLESMGAVDISIGVSDAPPPNLVAGGCRFGDDAKTSVLDRNCKAHEVKNLYVSDASFMPTGGSVPYTWSIYANSFRVADVIAKKLKQLSHRSCS